MDMVAIRTNCDADPVSYYALRVSRDARAGAWWRAVSERPDAPLALAALLAGRTRVELSRDEAVEALAWAASVDGWEGADHKPLTLCPAPAASA